MLHAEFDRLAFIAPPQVWFCVSAFFHYLGPSFAVLLFSHVGVLGVAWYRIATATIFFALLTNPWKTFNNSTRDIKLLLLAMGACLAIMNTSFYLALDKLPMSLVASIEFVSVIAIALYSIRSNRNLFALALTIVGVFILLDFQWSKNSVGLFFAILNALLFACYIVLAHKAAEKGASKGIEMLGAAMCIAFLIIMPIGFLEATGTFSIFKLIMAGIGVGICSSVIPYICDQLSMSRLSRSSFALLMSLMPVTATVIATIVLAQIPSKGTLAGILLVMIGIAIHRPAMRQS